MLGYLRRLNGSKALTFEESTGAQWLYTELKDEVDELIVCDPYRNHLLKEGPKTDRIDARKLAELLRAGLLKPVYHSGEEFLRLRKLVRGYSGVVRAMVRVKCQHRALMWASGKDAESGEITGKTDRFVMEGLDRMLETCKAEKARYEAEFKHLTSRHRLMRYLKSVPGIGDIGAVKIVAIVVDAHRFPTVRHFLSYCGLVTLDRISGGKVYGRKSPRCCRELKSVFKTAARCTIREHNDNPMRDYYCHLLNEKNLASYNAAHGVARYIARVVFGILKSPAKYNPERREACSVSA